ncbi:hypothetical protein FEM48_Zijuj04G0121400 [Ziziphus jujuba var. spinosa]|uniref:Retrotransposon Copia-like N-terminal domain-containing protein n=1 Tax=Ziziphus jujuba var. spinosa TaxID=714518 RepID=A0A978VJS9_ZIZJJ|nr:hypothetical protein FEM48_Zijuj04G0121400 [Ziziphus jujuba var. spinosa]
MSETNLSNIHTSPNTHNVSSTLVYLNVSAQAPLKLIADNYTAWHAQWYSLLIGCDLMDLVTSHSMCPKSYPNKISKDEKSISAYKQTVQGLVDSLALAGESLGIDEITFHILNGLGLKYKEISTAIWARHSSINFVKLHDKVADYEAFLKPNRTTIDYVSPVTANYASRGHSSSHTQQQSTP